MHKKQAAHTQFDYMGKDIDNQGHKIEGDKGLESQKNNENKTHY